MAAPTNQASYDQGAPQSRFCSRQRDRRAEIGAVLGLTAIGALTGALSLLPARPALVWNTTQSAPLGLYRVEARQPALGALLAVEPAAGLRAMLEEAGALRRGRLLLKPLAAKSGDTVCRDGKVIAINSEISAVAHERTSDGRSLPYWSGCKRLAHDEFFLLSSHPDSFDSRYFGPIKVRSVVGVARPILTFAPPPNGALR